MKDNLAFLYPYLGIQYQEQTMTFDTHWRVIEKSLGSPDFRFLETYPRDAKLDSEITSQNLAIVGEKEDFKEIRGSFQFVYESGTLQMIEIMPDIFLQTDDYVFSHNATEDYANCTEKCGAEFFVGIKTFALAGLGVLVKSLNGNGYAVCSRSKYADYVSVMRFYEGSQLEGK